MHIQWIPWIITRQRLPCTKKNMYFIALTSISAARCGGCDRHTSAIRLCSTKSLIAHHIRTHRCSPIPCECCSLSYHFICDHYHFNAMNRWLITINYLFHIYDVFTVWCLLFLPDRYRCIQKPNWEIHTSFSKMLIIIIRIIYRSNVCRSEICVITVAHRTALHQTHLNGNRWVLHRNTESNEIF